MPVNLTNIGEITPATSPLEVNGSLNLVGTGVGYQVNGAALITGLGVQHGGTAVGSQPAINLIDTTSASWTVANNAGNNRVDISVVATGAGYLPDPTTTLGDTLVRGATAIARLAVGTNGQVLQADSTAPNGVAWHTRDASNINLNPTGTTWTTIQDAIEGLETDSPGSLLTAQGDLLTRSATALARLAHGTQGQVLTVDTAQPNAIHWAALPASPGTILTTLGDLIVRGTTAPVRLAVGTNGQVLAADSTAPNGLHWTTLDAADIDLAPQVGTWTTVQAAVAGLHTASPSSLLTAQGDLLTRSGTALVRMAHGTNGQVLTVDTAQPNAIHWATPDPSPSDILTTKGDLLTHNATTAVRHGVGTNNQVVMADSTTTDGIKWATMTADLVSMNPTLNTTWTTVQNSIAAISSALTVLSRGMAYVGFYNASTDAATFVPGLATLDGTLPAANATGLEEGDFLVVTAAGTHAGLGQLNVGDQLISGGPTGGATWLVLPIGTNMASVTAATVPLSPDLNSWGTVQAAITSLNTRAQPAGAATQIQWNAGGTPPLFGASSRLFWTGTALSVRDATGFAGVSFEGTVDGTFGNVGTINASNTLVIQAGLAHVHISGANSNVGIGDSFTTTLPMYKLEVEGDTNIKGATSLNQWGYRINGILLASLNANTTQINLTNVATINGNAAITSVAPLTLDVPNSRVGVNQASPLFALDVVGAINTTLGVYVNGVLFAEPGSAHLRATDITGLDGKPLKFVAADGRETDIDSLLNIIDRLEARLKELEIR